MADGYKLRPLTQQNEVPLMVATGKIPKPCRRCHGPLTTEVYCRQCKPVAAANAAERTAQRHTRHDRIRGSARERGYSSTWDKLSKQHLADNPLCVKCLEIGLTVAATVTDHIIPIDVAPEKKFDKDNLMSLCTSCNTLKGKTTDKAIREALG